MKKLTFILLAFVLIASACKKDDTKEDDGASNLAPTSTQNGFAINYTATWCGYCGDWGAPLIHTYATGAPNGAVLTTHASGDPMTNSLYNSFKADRITGGGIPAFWVGDEKTTANGAMTTLIGSGSAKAGVDYTYEISGTTMTITTKTKFFAPAAKKYFLSVLVLEDGIDGSSSAGQYKQGGTSTSYPNDDYHHDFVLRKSSITGQAYGEEIASSPAADSEVEKTYTITIDASWKNTYPVVIIWEQNPGSTPQYKFINSLKKK